MGMDSGAPDGDNTQPAPASATSPPHVTSAKSGASPFSSPSGPAWVSAIAALITAVVGLVGIFVANLAPSQTAAPTGPGAVATASQRTLGSALVPSVVPTVDRSPAPTPERTQLAVDFNAMVDLVRQRAREAGIPSTPDQVYRYLTASGNGLAIDVPEPWDLGPGGIAPWLADSAEYQIIGSSIAATPDEEGLFGERQAEFATPGLFLAASRSLAESYRPNSLLDTRTGYYASVCTLTDHVPVQEERYAGAFEVFTGCNGQAIAVLELELSASDSSHIVGLHFRALDEADLLALQRALGSFEVTASRLLR